MHNGIKFALAAILASVLFAVARGDLASIRALATDSAFYTTQTAELTRLEKEMLTFRMNAALMVDGEEVYTPEAVKLSFDILWSRVNTEGTRFINPRIDAIRNYQATFDGLAAELRTIDHFVQSLEIGDHAGLREIEVVMQKYAPAISQMNNDAYAELYARATELAVRQRGALKSVDHMQWVFVAVGLSVILLLLFQLRNSEKHYKQLQAREADIRTLAAVDPLTGLSNRRHFDERMRAIDDGEWRGDIHMLLVDLDGFKLVNDREGHAAGDHVLRVVSRRLTVATHHRALIARLGGDEFAVVINGKPDEAKAAAHDIVREVAKPIYYDNVTLRVGASIGVAALRGSDALSSVMLQEADDALYEAKAQGRGRACHFDELAIVAKSAFGAAGELPPLALTAKQSAA